MQFGDFLFIQLKKQGYNLLIVLDKDDLLEGLNIKSIVYEEKRPTCEYHGTLQYIKNCLLLATPEEIRKAIFNDTYEEEDNATDMNMEYIIII